MEKREIRERKGEKRGRCARKESLYILGAVTNETTEEAEKQL